MLNLFSQQRNTMLLCRRPYNPRIRKLLSQFGNAAGMVGVVMGDEDGLEAQPVGGQPRRDRRCVAAAADRNDAFAGTRPCGD